MTSLSIGPMRDVAGVEELVGRDAERARIAELIAGARAGAGGVLALRGEPGIGKTALLHEARALAEDELGVLAATGVEGESEIPFAALLTLLGPALPMLDRLPERQRAALEGALALGPPAGGDLLTLGAAVLGLLDAAAEERPLLVLVDDAQWLDRASAEVVLFAARRLEGERVALLLAIRDGEGDELNLAGIPELRLAGLGRADAARLLGRIASAPPGGVVDALVEATGGNPLALIELPAALSPEQLGGSEPVGEPVAVGARLRDAFLRRVQALSAPARHALLLAAASSSDDVEPVVRAARALGIDIGALEEAERAGLIELSGEERGFRHPLVRAAVYHGADPAERRRAHAALADAEVLPARRAWHLAAAATAPDDAAAEQLEAAAQEALARAGQGAAAAALERAARLTSAGPERAARLVRAAEQRLLAGSAGRAVELANEALEQNPSTLTRALAGQVLSRLELLRGSLDSAHRRGVEAAELVMADHPEVAAGMLMEAGLPGFMAGRIETALTTMKRAYDLAEERAPAIGAAPAVLYGAALTISGHFEEGAPLLGRWLETHVPERMLMSPPELIGATQSLTWIEQYEAVRSICDRLIDLARSVGAAGPLQLALAQRADVNYRLGDWSQARADASESVRLAEATGQLVQACFPLVVLARLEVAIGRREDAQRRWAEVSAVSDRSGMGSMRAYIAAARCLDALATGDVEAAVAAGREARELVTGFGMRDPSVLHWQGDLIEALVRAGHDDEARAEIDALTSQAQLTGRAWVAAAAARGRGLLAPADEFDACFAEALAHHARGADPFERGRTELAYGERLRRARRPVDAREVLRAALATFERLGAEPWARRARAELRASGGATPAAPGSALSNELTAQELEVALLATRGMTNREAAAALYLSPKTIEAHLSRVYRKLGVRSRTELAARLGGSGAVQT